MQSYGLVMIFSYGEPGFTCTASFCTRTNDAVHLARMRGITLIQHVLRSYYGDVRNGFEAVQVNTCAVNMRV